MLCGSLGFKNQQGQPCGQDIASDAKGCRYHLATLEQKTEIGKLGVKAYLDRTIKKLDLNATPVPLFNSFANIISFTQDMAWLALVGSVDLQRINVALKAASVARETVGTAIQEKIANALLKLEHGGAAVAFLTKLSEGSPKRLSEVIDLKNGHSTSTEENGSAIFIDGRESETEQEAESAIQRATKQLETLIKTKPNRTKKMQADEVSRLYLGFFGESEEEEEEVTRNEQLTHPDSSEPKSEPIEPLPTDPSPSVGKVTFEETME